MPTRDAPVKARDDAAAKTGEPIPRAGSGVADSPPDLGPVRRLLAIIRRRARAWILVESLGWLAIAVGLFFWCTLAVDRAVEPPAWVRGVVVAVAALSAAFAAARLLGRLRTPLSDEALAAVVERRHPEFRDTLSTAIALGDAAATAEATSATVAIRPDEQFDSILVARTTAEATRLVPRVRLTDLFRGRRLLMLAGAGMVCTGSVAALAVTRPAVAGTWARRLFALADEPWPRRVALHAEGFSAGVRTVARGSDVEVLVRATAAGTLPEVVELRWLAPAGWRVERMGTRGNAVTDDGGTRRSFGHAIRGVADDLMLEIRCGDARLRDLRLRVVDPPAVTALTIEYERPEYLGGGRRSAAAARVVRIPRGSRVAIEAAVSKPLSAGFLAIRDAKVGPDGQSGPERIVAELGEPATAAALLSGVLGTLDHDLVAIVRLTDTDGIANREPIEFLLSAVADDPPRVALRPRGVSTAVTPGARIPLEGVIADDHGLAAATVRIDVVPAASSETLAPSATAAAGDARADRRRSLPVARVVPGATVVDLPEDDPEIVSLEPLGLDVGGRIELVVEARDACTLDDLPNLGVSDAWTFDIVTPESLRSLLEAREVLLRRRCESVIADLTQARDRLVEAAVRRNAAGRPDGAAAGVTGDDAADGGGEPWLAASRRLGEAASRAAGETGDIADSFLGIRLELDNNRMLTPEVEQRLVVEIAEPLRDIVAQDLPVLSARAAALAADAAAGEPPQANTAGGSGAAVEALGRQADDVLVRLRAVLDRMMELESFNEMIERLRGVIRLQEEIRTRTLDEQKRRAREALERL